MAKIWRDLPMFVCFVVAIALVDVVEKALTSRLGAWGAWGVGVLAGVAFIMVASSTIHRLYYGREKAQEF